MKQQYQLLVRSIFISCGLSLVGCGGGSSGDPSVNEHPEFSEVPLNSGTVQVASLKLSKPENCQANKDFLIDSIVKTYTQDAYYKSIYTTITMPPMVTGGGGGGGGVATPATTPARLPANNSVTQETPNTFYSGGTNVQEVGVDEADTLKVEHSGVIFQVVNNRLLISNGLPAKEMKLLSDTELTLSKPNAVSKISGAVPLGIYLDETSHQIVAILNGYFDSSVVEMTNSTDSVATNEMKHAPVGTMSVVNYKPITGVLFVDVSDTSKPVVRQQIIIEGAHSATRRVGNHLIAVTSHTIILPVALTTNSEFSDAIIGLRDAQSKLHLIELDDTEEKSERLKNYQAAMQELATNFKAKIHKLVATAIAAQEWSELVPHIYRKSESLDEQSDILSCGDFYQPSVRFNSPQLLSVHSIDLSDGGVKTASVATSSGIVYASKKNIYVAQHSNGWWYSPDQKEQTAVYQFNIEESQPKYIATGAIDGTISHSFHMSEYEDHLRVVSNGEYRPIIGVAGRTNNLYVLAKNDSTDLITTGSVRNFGKNESIMSARFLGKRAFVVTFRRIDPLFAFDLADPNEPRLVGEIEIPGFSTYIHQLGDHHLLTIGRAADEKGRVSGLQLQIFDVTEMSIPKLVHKKEITSSGDGWEMSLSEYDHRTFYFDDERKLLLVAVNSYNYISSSKNSESKLYALKIDVENGIDLVGTIDQTELVKNRLCAETNSQTTSGGNVSDANTIATISDYCSGKTTSFPFFVYGWPSIQRGFILGADDKTFVYAVSPYGVNAVDTSDYATTVGSVAYPSPLQPPMFQPMRAGF